MTYAKTKAGSDLSHSTGRCRSFLPQQEKLQPISDKRPWWIRRIILFLTDVGLPPWKLLRFKEIRLLSQKLFFVSFITNARLLISDGSKELWLFHRCRNFITWDWFNLTYFIQSWNKEVKRSNFQFLKRCDTPILVYFRVFTSSPFQTRRLVNNSYKVEFL